MQGVVPLFRFSTGHELCRVTTLERMTSWRDSISPDGLSAGRDSFCTEHLFELSEEDVDRGIYVLLRDGSPVRFLFLERRNTPLGFVEPLACLKKALPGHPEEDPDQILQIWRWFVDQAWRGDGEAHLWPSPKGSSSWYSLVPPGEIEIEYLLSGDEEVRGLLGLETPYVFPLRLFMEWADCAEHFDEIDKSVDTVGINE